MPRWFALTEDHLRAIGHGAIIDKAQSLATGAIDPVSEVIGNAVARIRRAVSAGNVLDADSTKVPGSLKGPAEKLALFDLMARIGLPLSPSQQQDQRDIGSDLHRVCDSRLKVELADDPEPSPTVADTGTKVSSTHVPRRQTGRGRTSGL